MKKKKKKATLPISSLSSYFTVKNTDFRSFFGIFNDQLYSWDHLTMLRFIFYSPFAR